MANTRLNWLKVNDDVFVNDIDTGSRMEDICSWSHIFHLSRSVCLSLGSDRLESGKWNISTAYWNKVVYISLIIVYTIQHSSYRQQNRMNGLHHVLPRIRKQKVYTKPNPTLPCPSKGHTTSQPSLICPTSSISTTFCKDQFPCTSKQAQSQA